MTDDEIGAELSEEERFAFASIREKFGQHFTALARYSHVDLIERALAACRAKKRVMREMLAIAKFLFEKFKVADNELFHCVYCGKGRMGYRTHTETCPYHNLEEFICALAALLGKE